MSFPWKGHQLCFRYSGKREGFKTIDVSVPFQINLVSNLANLQKKKSPNVNCTNLSEQQRHFYGKNYGKFSQITELTTHFHTMHSLSPKVQMEIYPCNLNNNQLWLVHLAHHYQHNMLFSFHFKSFQWLVLNVLLQPFLDCHVTNPLPLERRMDE